MGDNNNNDLLVPGARDSVENLKNEISNELGVQPGADTTARDNGAVGGEMVKRMIRIAESSMSNRNK
ncbi:alpha/beta-type small acid-soluble spore protein [Virgibacillus siamensis]|uniref:alpha/beta-type small acid-soluble spore protein n=1 Tax=Virgibacillus siamensis TaxID=480071 RepID=UPI000984FC87|nr:alpha/beta-type small acid-soluble spore protein [Virgibacillus siamensis]